MLLTNIFSVISNSLRVFAFFWEICAHELKMTSKTFCVISKSYLISVTVLEKKMKCSGDSEIQQEIVHDTGRINSCLTNFRVVSRNPSYT